MLSPKNKRNIARIIPYGVLWFIFSLIYCLLEKSILGNMDHYPSTGVQYDFVGSITVIPIASLMMGLMTGVLEIGYFNNWLIKKSFARKIIFKSFIYLVIVVGFLLIITIINMLYNEDKRSLEDLSSPAWAFFKDYALMGVILYIASIVVITQFYAEFSESMGQGTLHNFFFRKVPSSHSGRKNIYVPGYEVLHDNSRKPGTCDVLRNAQGIFLRPFSGRDRLWWNHLPIRWR